jgi:hypothetical protein
MFARATVATKIINNPAIIQKFLVRHLILISGCKGKRELSQIAGHPSLY